MNGFEILAVMKRLKNVHVKCLLTLVCIVYSRTACTAAECKSELVYSQCPVTPLAPERTEYSTAVVNTSNSETVLRGIETAFYCETVSCFPSGQHIYNSIQKYRSSLKIVFCFTHVCSVLVKTNPG